MNIFKNCSSNNYQITKTITINLQNRYKEEYIIRDVDPKRTIEQFKKDVSHIINKQPQKLIFFDKDGNYYENQEIMNDRFKDNDIIYFESLK
ncbi:hypothetical protein pb186bvf_007103 [Paramecium bursaria]